MLLEEKLKVAEMEKEQANNEILELREKLLSLQKEKERAELKTRNEMKTLAREIKTLRKSQPELKEDLEMALKDKAKLEVCKHCLLFSRHNYAQEFSELMPL